MTQPLEGSVTTCYRHPDRRAGVSCQRCDRPICPSCMVSASVGFQCPECAQAGSKQQRLVDVHRAATQPIVTYVLIGISVAMFIAGQLFQNRLGGSTGLTFDERFSLISGAAARTADGTLVTVGVADGEWWRIITSGFMHAS